MQPLPQEPVRLLPRADRVADSLDREARGDGHPDAAGRNQAAEVLEKSQLATGS